MNGYIQDRKEAQHWLIRNGLMDTDLWRMDYKGNIIFYPERPKGLPIDWYKMPEKVKA